MMLRIAPPAPPPLAPRPAVADQGSARRRTTWLVPLLLVLVIVSLLVIGPAHLADLAYRLPVALAVLLFGTTRVFLGLWGLRRAVGLLRFRVSAQLSLWLASASCAVWIVLWHAGLVAFVAVPLCIAAALVCAELGRKAQR